MVDEVCIGLTELPTSSGLARSSVASASGPDAAAKVEESTVAATASESTASPCTKGGPEDGDSEDGEASTPEAAVASAPSAGEVDSEAARSSCKGGESDPLGTAGQALPSAAAEACAAAGEGTSAAPPARGSAASARGAQDVGVESSTVRVKPQAAESPSKSSTADAAAAPATSVVLRSALSLDLRASLSRRSVRRSGAAARGSFKEVYHQEQGSLLKARCAEVGMPSLPGGSASALLGDPDPADPEAPGKTAGVEATMGINGAFFNLTNCCVGCTLVTLPLSCARAGVIPFMTCMVITALLSLMSADMIVKAADCTGYTSLEMIGVQALGSRKRGILGTSALIILGLYVPLILYLSLLTDTSPVANKLMGQDFDDKKIMIVIVSTVVFPLCLIRDQAYLAFSSMLALAVFLAVGVTTVWSVGWDNGYATDAAPGFKKGLTLWGPYGITESIKSCSPIMMAFEFQTSVLPIYQQLKNPTPKRMQTVNARSVLAAFLFYALVGVFGAAAFSTETANSVLKNFRHCKCSKHNDDGMCIQWDTEGDGCADDLYWGLLLNVAFCLAIVIGYPNLHFTVRCVQVSTFWPGEEAPFSWAVHVGYTALNVVLTAILAMCVAKDLEQVFNWAGVLSSPLQAFLVPGAFYYWVSKKKKSTETMKIFFVMMFGLVVMVTGTALMLCVKDE